MRAYLGIDLDYVDQKVEGFPNLNKVKSQHITLCHWKDLPESQAAEIVERLGTYKNNRFNLTASTIYAFPNSQNPDLLGLQFDSTEKIRAFQKDILTHLGVEVPEKFEPHITLIRKEKLDGAFKRSKDFVCEVSPIKVPITNVALYQSHPDKAMNDYTLLKKVELEE